MSKTPRRPHILPASGPPLLTERQAALAELLAALLVADYRAYPPGTVASPSGPDRAADHALQASGRPR